MHFKVGVLQSLVMKSPGLCSFVDASTMLVCRWTPVCVCVFVCVCVLAHEAEAEVEEDEETETRQRQRQRQRQT